MNRGSNAGSSLTLNVQKVLNLSDESNTLVVRRSAANEIQIGAVWTLTGTEFIDDRFDVYQQGAATLKIQRVATTFSITDPASTPDQLLRIQGPPFDFGHDVSSAGDFNGDGFDDLLVSNYRANCTEGSSTLYSTGEVYVIFGGPGLVPNVTPSAPELAFLNLPTVPTNGYIVIRGAEPNDRIGRSIASLGDVNGDGFDDVLIGADNADIPGNAYAGKAYVVFGSATPSDVLLSDNLGTAGLAIIGANSGAGVGHGVGGGGDINGDGLNDIVVGTASGAAAGAAYVIFGSPTLGGTLDLANVGTAGIRFTGPSVFDGAGRAVSITGDIDGDGFDDLLIGAPYANGQNGSFAGQGSGEVYLGFGGPNLSNIDLAAPPSQFAFVKFVGGEGDGFFGVSLKAAGDFNGDGFDDFIVGSRSADKSFVVFGKAERVGFDLLNGGQAGIEFSGPERTGYSVSGAGDVNGDGFDDLLVGAYRAGEYDAGAKYVVFGEPNPLAVIDLTGAAWDGFVVLGADERDFPGVSVSNAGDLNGDGLADIIIGANRHDFEFPSTGFDAYVIYGDNFSGDITQRGTNASETLTGTAADDAIIGGRSDDTLIGGGGADVLYGGEGDDVLAVSDLIFSRLDGGRGFDTLRLDAAGLALDLTLIANSRIQNIEAIDISGSGDSSLTLNVAEVLSLSGETNELIVRRDRGDLVDIGSGWTTAPLETIGDYIFLGNSLEADPVDGGFGIDFVSNSAGNPLGPNDRISALDATFDEMNRTISLGDGPFLLARLNFVVPNNADVGDIYTINVDLAEFTDIDFMNPVNVTSTPGTISVAAAVPEPSSMAFAVIGLVGAGLRHRSRKRKSVIANDQHRVSGSC